MIQKQKSAASGLLMDDGGPEGGCNMNLKIAKACGYQDGAQRDLEEMKRVLDAGQQAHSIAREEHAHEQSR